MRVRYQMRQQPDQQELLLSAAAMIQVEEYHGIAGQAITETPFGWMAACLFEELHLDDKFSDQVLGASPFQELKAEKIARMAAFKAWRRGLLVLEDADQGKDPAQ